MGCFLPCIGSSKRRKQRRKRNASDRTEQFTVSSGQDQDDSKTELSPTSQFQAKPEEQRKTSPRKKVTFDSNVKTYEPVVLDEVADLQPEKSEDGGKEESLVKSSLSKSCSEDSLVTSTGSFPSNHRYHNCLDSGDEDGEMDCWDSDLTDEEEEEEEDCGSDIEEEYNEVGEDFEDGIVYSSSIAYANEVEVVDDEVKSPISTCDRDVKSNARIRSVYVHPVLNPVENLTQWKAVKAKRTAPTFMPQKENSILSQGSPTAFDAKSSRKLNEDIAVDASLSNWLVSSETTPVKKSNSAVSCAGTPEWSSSQGSNSVISHEDRPILGALTVEELKQFSASSSPRKSPSRSPDEMPIIGNVGRYWNFVGSAEDSGSATFKGTRHGASSRYTSS